MGGEDSSLVGQTEVKPEVEKNRSEEKELDNSPCLNPRTPTIAMQVNNPLCGMKKEEYRGKKNSG